MKDWVNKTTERIKSKRKMLACMALYATMQMNTVICYAATAKSNAVTKGLDNLKVLVLAIIGTIGAIYLAKSIFEFATAYQQADSSGMNSALKGIAGGAMMAGVSTIIGILGF